jgi:hypothetical protein
MPRRAWRLTEYPKRTSADRESRGLDRCGSAGAARVLDLARLARDGRAIDPGTSLPLTTPPLESADVWIFAVREGRLRLAQDGGSRMGGNLPPDAIKHETLFANLPVNAAGEIQFRDGQVIGINTQSGTYPFTFDADFKGAILEAIMQSGVAIHPTLRSRLIA